MKAIIFTDTAGQHGFGRAAGAYRIATEFRLRGDQIKVVDCFNSFSQEEVKEVIRKYVTSKTEFIGFSTTFLNDVTINNKWDQKNNRVKSRQELTDYKEDVSALGLSKYEQDELFDFIRGMGLKVVLGGYRREKADRELQRENVTVYTGPVESHLFRDQKFNFTKSQILYEEEDLIFEEEDLPIEVARGCIFKCKFCAYPLNGKGLWEFVKDPETLREEMMRNYIKFGTTGYIISDDTYNDSPDKITKLLEMYKTLPFDLRFSAYARLDLIIAKPWTADVLVESGMKSVLFGIETLHPRAGKLIGKGMDPDKVKKGLLDFRKKYPDVLVYASMIAGLPHETLEDCEESFRFLTEEAKVHTIDYNALFLGGSEFGRNPEKYGYTKSNNNKRSWTRDDGLTYLETMEWAISKVTAYDSSPAGFVGYNRLHNIGYSHDEMMNLRWSKDGQSVWERTMKAREKYIKKIL